MQYCRFIPLTQGFVVTVFFLIVGCRSHRSGPLLAPSDTAPTTSALVTGPTTRRVERAGVAVYVDDELLTDYRPHPALITRVSDTEKPKFPVIDIHCHWFIQQNAKEMLLAMDRLGIEKANNLSGGYGRDLDKMLTKFHSVAPERLLVFCNLDFAHIDDAAFPTDVAKDLESARAKGVSGLKIFKSLGLTTKDSHGTRIAIDDPRLDAAWSTCGRLHMPVLIHSGDPTAFFQPVDRYNERWMQLKRHPDWRVFSVPSFRLMTR